MGVLSDLKKLFFGASSVAKSASSHAEEFIKEEGSEILEKAKDFSAKSADTISQKTSGLKDSILENSKELMEKAKDKVEELADNPVVEKMGEVSEKVGEKILDTGSELMEKAADVSESVGKKVIEKGGEALEKSKDLSENVGEKILDIKDDIVDKAKEVANKAGEKLNETMDKAEAWAEAEKLKPQKEFADETLTTGDSLLQDTDDFFSKADKFAKGEYDSFSEGKITIEPAKELPQKPVEKATGFKDLDGDGNEIIDDAIIDPE